MEQNHFKWVSLSLFIIIIWVLYPLIQLLAKNSSWTEGFMVIAYFVLSIFFFGIIGLVSIAIRLISKKFKSSKFYNFLYVFSGLINISIFVVWLISVFSGITLFFIGLTIFVAASTLIGLFIIIDLYVLEKR